MKRLVAPFVALLLALAPGTALAGTIGFDTDAAGKPLDAPPTFRETTPLTDLYASLGVRFHGPGPNRGGMILNRESNFGVRARSAPNFLAFNRQSRGRGPEVITFAEPQRRVLIFAAAGDQGQGPDTFSITGSLKSQTVARASLEVSGRQYGRLKVVSETGIDSVRIRGHHANVFVLDDLRFSPVR